MTFLILYLLLNLSSNGAECVHIDLSIVLMASGLISNINIIIVIHLFYIGRRHRTIGMNHSACCSMFDETLAEHRAIWLVVAEVHDARGRRDPTLIQIHISILVCLVNDRPRGGIVTRPQTTMRAHGTIFIDLLVKVVPIIYTSVITHLFNTGYVAFGELVNTAFLRLCCRLSSRSCSSMTSPDLSIVWWRMLVLWWRRFADLGICSFEVTRLIISILLGLGCRTYIVLHNILVIVIVGHLLEHLIVNVSIIYIILLLYFFSNPGARQMITIICAHQNFPFISISHLMNSDRLTSLLELLISLL